MRGRRARCVTSLRGNGPPGPLLTAARETIVMQDALRWLAPTEAILGGVVTKKREALVTLTTIGKVRHRLSVLHSYRLLTKLGIW